MKLHANAPLGPKDRAVMARRVVEGGLMLASGHAATAPKVRLGCWIGAQLPARFTTPHPSTASRRLPRCGAYGSLALRSAEVLEMATSTVSAVLTRMGLGKLSRLAPPEPVRRCERRRPGELIHIDVKKSSAVQATGSSAIREAGSKPRSTARAYAATRRVGSGCMSASMTPRAWPTSRFCPMKRPTRRSASSSAPLPSIALTGIVVERLMTDNGSPIAPLPMPWLVARWA
jgi:hypothetical protein